MSCDRMSQIGNIEIIFCSRFEMLLYKFLRSQLNVGRHQWDRGQGVRGGGAEWDRGQGGSA